MLAGYLLVLVLVLVAAPDSAEATMKKWPWTLCKGYCGIDPTSGCEPGFTSIPGFAGCFSWFTTPMTWNEAWEVCQLCGADLVKLDDVKQHYVLVNYIKRYPELCDVEGLDGYWIGANDVTTDGSFIWSTQGGQHTGAAVTFTNWYTGLPDVTAGNLNDCVSLYKSYDYRWADFQCNGGGANGRVSGAICWKASS